MPGRSTPIVTGEMYHIFNRGIDRRPTFTAKREYDRAIETIKFYRFFETPVSLSRLFSLPRQLREETLDGLVKYGEKQVETICFCLMPNHFHFLLKQVKDKGVSRFLSNFQNSYTRYFNKRHDRTGPLFLDQFKAVHIETDEQALHVHRYIHINPYTSYVVKTIQELTVYPWSSFPEYLTHERGFIEKDLVMAFFKNLEAYREFIFDQVDYQRELDAIKHLIFE